MKKGRKNDRFLFNFLKIIFAVKRTLNDSFIIYNFSDFFKRIFVFEAFLTVQQYSIV